MSQATSTDPYDSLASLLFHDQFQDGDHEAYLADLTSYNLDRLSKEPTLLAAQTSQIQSEMQQLAFSNYKSFIHSAECIRSVHGEISRASSKVSGLLEELPALSSACELFAKAAQDVAAARAINGQTLSHLPNLLDLLSLPQHMNDYIRSGSYDEALMIESFAHKLEKMHPDIPIIQDIVADVKIGTDQLLLQLQNKLKTKIPLSQCLAVVGLIKRLDIFDDMQLRLCFLKSRDLWLQTSLDAIRSDNPYTYLGKVADISRALVFDIITQYRAIFSEEQESGILHSWLVQKVSQFLETLDTHLPRIAEGASIANILDQCMFYGVSLGRVGVDFRGLLAPIFEKHIYYLFMTTITTVSLQFATNLKSHKWVSVPLGSSNYSFPDNKEDSFTPPSVLLEHPPIAYLVNGYLSAYNELRQCAPLSLLGQAWEVVDKNLQQVVSSLKSYYCETHLSPQELLIFQDFCKVMREPTVPYLVRCFDHIYGVVHPRSSLSVVNQILVELIAGENNDEDFELDLDLPEDDDEGEGEEEVRDDIEEEEVQKEEEVRDEVEEEDREKVRAEV